MFYDDPRLADGTRDEAATYDRVCREIASELAFLFARIKALANSSRRGF
jgi:hypothetical protein